jgi:hypothetical protein
VAAPAGMGGKAEMGMRVKYGNALAHGL